MLSLSSKEIKNYNQQENAVYIDHPPSLGPLVLKDNHTVLPQLRAPVYICSLDFV
jgi:hypothetical protein